MEERRQLITAKVKIAVDFLKSILNQKIIVSRALFAKVLILKKTITAQ